MSDELRDLLSGCVKENDALRARIVAALALLRDPAFVSRSTLIDTLAGPVTDTP